MRTGITWAESISFPRPQFGFSATNIVITPPMPWQSGGDHGGIDPDDVQALVKLNTEGRVHLVPGDDVEIFPGIRAYTGSRHTYASQYLQIEGHPTFVLASDNAY